MKRNRSTILAVLFFSLILFVPTKVQASGFFDFFSNDMSKVVALAEENLSSSEHLWTSSASIEKLTIPVAAYSGGAQVCRGMAPDGITFLMTDNVVPYLWNQETGQSMDLKPADTVTEELLHHYLTVPANVASDKASELQASFDALSGRELLEAYLSQRSGFPMGPRAVYGILDIEGNYLAASDAASGMIWLINCDTGELSASDKQHLTAVKNGQAIYTSAPPEANVFIKDLMTGSVLRQVNCSLTGGFASGASVKTADMLSDGSLCVVLRDAKIDPKQGEDCVLAVNPSESDEEVYPLGKIRFGQEPDVLLTCGDQYLICFSRNYIMYNAPYLIDRITGKVSLLIFPIDGQVTAVPLENCLDENGCPVSPTDEIFPFFLDKMADGKTLLVYQPVSGCLYLYRPETEETHALTSDQDGMGAPIIFCSNHNGKFFTDREGLCELRPD